jgi:hypothetical protein
MISFSLVEQLFEQTGIPPERQNIAVGAHAVLDDTDLRTLGLKPNQVQSLIF